MTLLSIITGTPWWVWGVFYYLLMVGISSLKTRHVPLLRLFIVPAVFSFLGGLGIHKSYGFSPLTLTCWIAGIAIGIVLGWIFVRRSGVKVICHKRCLLSIPGSRSTLIILWGFFFVKYARGMTFALHPELRFIPTIMIIDLVVMGFFLGFLVGRLAFYVREITRPQI